ncbi:MAG: hypothetical protein ACD_13C00144G0033 [uncultured bacterium]|uniref:Glycosyltransferase RgtA/B/C/D-like domain-containing protein n=1 Tax=Candidatus Woesebacteria bacterium GW2011_GWA1_40_43 TaxID=1618553 RepID=A0A0G0SQR6_9BACT|nr:MAG: hypothetical protein ACD_13C00144G0033 [uncultured bacterium]KKR53918.1 MAG: hypothetical protein UT88_C0005G0026 [Candidatus Woesebacteria bacterium GW2011_GWD2_40_19]KKR58636.1 MAG: hypothetical protein UT96_C0002G0039 [Candidatus Woesebacteria bacterium GW2011_GWC2_40_30]KKR64761.1 MAG: hypothetical protein UU02_C0001G0015 [Candidatus Woesebacteria bacterium GW2011_GWA1_40_43]HAU65327.1 hypothetical protein [Candidatus Woesebacteria bacterium]
MYLNLSDSAKFADIARNLVNGLGYGSTFSFWSINIFELIKTKTFWSPWVPPVIPYSIAAFFKIFGVGDFAVIATSFFYFILTLVFVYFLGKRIFNSKLVGILSTLTIGFSYDLIHYATNGASESPFIFEIVAASYFASIKKKWASAVTILLLILMYFTRPQAFIYITGIVLYWLLINFKFKKALIFFGIISVVGFLVDYFVLMSLSGKYFLYSIIGRGVGSSFSQTSVASDVLRGATIVVEGGISQTLKNILYNLYNFYKLLPQIISSYLFGIFVTGLFLKSKNKTESSFKIVSTFIVAFTFLVTAASIPFFRYLHPVIPLVYIIATGTLVEIISKFEILNARQIPNPKSQIQNKRFTIIASTFLILLFGVGQTLGVLILDSRFEAKTHNVSKPPVYITLSKILNENTDNNQVVVTNLDTWGSWYGERRTAWFPLEPKQIIDPTTGKIPFDAIYLTNYLIDDANYYMGNDWRMIFNNPNDPKKWTCSSCDEIAKEFTLKGVYKVPASDNYERLDSSAILLIKK